MKTLFQGSSAAAAERLHRLEMLHHERLRAIDAKQPLPEVEVARAEMYATQARTAAASHALQYVAIVAAPAAVFGITVGATNVILVQADPAMHRYFIGLIWSAATLVSVAAIASVAAIGFLATLRLRALPLPTDEQHSGRLNGKATP